MYLSKRIRNGGMHQTAAHLQCRTGETQGSKTERLGALTFMDLGIMAMNERAMVVHQYILSGLSNFFFQRPVLPVAHSSIRRNN